MRVAGFFSKVPFHVQQVLLSRLRDETREEKLQAMKSNYSSQLKQKSKLPAMQSDELIDELKEVQVSAFAKVPSSHTQSNAPAVPESADTTCKQMETTQTRQARLKYSNER